MESHHYLSIQYILLRDIHNSRKKSQMDFYRYFKAIGFTPENLISKRKIMKQICAVGVGYVGLVTGACFADLGNKVAALDVDEKRVENLKKGIMPIYEPGLDELVTRNVKAGRLSFTTSYAEAMNGAEFAFIAVGTPSGVNGEADLQY